MKVAKAIVPTRQRPFQWRSFTPFRIALLSTLILLSASGVRAQNKPEILRPNEDEGPNLVDEMRVRWEIKYAEKERLENLDRAREASQIGAELYEAYEHNNGLTANDRKKLDRLEKVTKKIRSRAGGSDGDEAMSDMPNQMGPMLKRLSETVDIMCKAVEKTPRQIVSATVIERSNDVLEMIRWIRSFAR